MSECKYWPVWRRYAATLYQQNHAFDATQDDRLQRWRSVEPESAAFLAWLVQAKQAQSILEIGTSNGYATLWLAAAAQQTGAQLRTWEISAQRSALARQHAQAAGVAAGVQFEVGDAGNLLAADEHSYDLVFLDAERAAYAGYWPHLQRLLAQPGSVLVVDNVLSHADQVADLVALVATHADFSNVTLPLGAGLLLVTRITSTLD